MAKNNLLLVHISRILPFFIFLLFTCTEAQESKVKVERVIDGDTFVITGGEKVRLLGVDTPESVHPNHPVEYFGKEASNYTRKMLEGQMVELKSDPSNNNRDKFKRLLRYVYLSGEDFNKKLILDGYAYCYTRFPFRKLEEYRKAEREARENQRGLWANDKKFINLDSKEGMYWINLENSSRHNHTCRFFNNTRSGKFSDTKEGKACGICGG